jgi:DNA-binding transcriptional ArsR family regulator
MTAHCDATDVAPAALPTLVEMFQALGDPVRRRIVDEIAEAGEVTVASLESALRRPRPTISYPLKWLVHAGAVIARHDGPHVFYNMNVEMLDDAAQVLQRLAEAQTTVRHRRPHSIASLGRPSE